MEERIKELMEAQHITQQAFAEFLGISPATLSSIFSGRTKVTLNTIKAIKKKFPSLNYGWLLDGTGPMFNDGKPGDPSSATATPSSSSTGEAFIDFEDDPDSANANITPTPSDSVASEKPASASVQHNVEGFKRRSASVSQENTSTLHSNSNVVAPKIINNIRRSVSQILVIYDDQTCETFFPKK